MSSLLSLGPTQPDDKVNWPANVLEVNIGSPGALNPANVQDHADIQEWCADSVLHKTSRSIEADDVYPPYCRYAHLPSLLSERGFKTPLTLKVSDGGLEAIPEGLDELRQLKVSATKLAYRL